MCFFFQNDTHFRVKLDWGGGGHKVCDLAASCHKLETVASVYLPEKPTPWHSGASENSQWIEGKAVFSFSVMGLIIKRIQTFRDVAFAGTLHF